MVGRRHHASLALGVLVALVSDETAAAGPPGGSPPPSTQGAINTTRSNIKNTFRLAPGAAPTIATPIEIRFADPAGYDDFAAGRLPVSLVLRNAASGQTIRFDPLVLDGFVPSADKRSATLQSQINGVGPDLLARGCFETDTEVAPAGEGVRITITYSSCAPGRGAPQMTAPPVPGIGIVVKKGPPRHLVIVTGPSAVGGAAAARHARTPGVVEIVSSQGVASPQPQGF